MKQPRNGETDLSIMLRRTLDEHKLPQALVDLDASDLDRYFNEHVRRLPGPRGQIRYTIMVGQAILTSSDTYDLKVKFLEAVMRKRKANEKSRRG